VAIILDGNGRWARARGLPRLAGHRAGVQAVGRVVQAAPRLGIATLTLFAFSADNWERPQPEVNTLMRLLHEYLLAETEGCAAHGVRVSVIGRRDRVSARCARRWKPRKRPRRKAARYTCGWPLITPLAKRSFARPAASTR